MSSNLSYKDKIPLQNRKLEAGRMLNKYNDRIPVIVEKHSKSKNAPDINKNKYLVPDDLTFGQFIYIIRKRIKLDEEQALYTFINNRMPVTSDLMRTIYEKNASEDGLLYVNYAIENTFGSF
jgi:GABA(A) receptor-associated protein